MLIAIVSDMHIGYERFADDALLQAHEALEAAAARADVILLPGDIFDKHAPKPEYIAQAINLFRELSRRKWNARVSAFQGTGIKAFTEKPIIAVSGTHERTAEGKDNPLKLLALAGLLIDASEASVTVENGDEKLHIFGLGGLSEERVRSKLAELAPKPIPGEFNVFMFHQSIYELLPFSEDFIHYDELPAGFDLYVDGHIHSRVEAIVHGKRFLIPGSTVLTQLKDGEQESKGFILFDTKLYKCEFIPIKSRPFVSQHISLENATPKSLEDACSAAIDSVISNSKEKPIMRLVLEGTIKDGFTSVDMPLHALVAKYADSAVLAIDSSKLVSAEQRESLEAIRNDKLDGLSVRETGINILLTRLKELKLEKIQDPVALFSTLSGEDRKEKILDAAMALLASD